MSDCTTVKGGGHDHDHDHDHKHHQPVHDHDHDHDHDHKGSGGDKHHSHGHDTINLGSGHDTHCHAGNATVHGSVTIKYSAHGLSHSSTLAGGSQSTSFLHATTHSLTHHGLGSDTLAGAAHVA